MLNLCFCVKWSWSHDRWSRGFYQPACDEMHLFTWHWTCCRCSLYGFLIMLQWCQIISISSCFDFNNHQELEQAVSPVTILLSFGCLTVINSQWLLCDPSETTLEATEGLQLFLWHCARQLFLQVREAERARLVCQESKISIHSNLMLSMDTTQLSAL